MSRSYPLQQVSTAGTVVKVPGGEVDPSHVARQLTPISDAMGRVIEADRAGFLQTIEVALSITANGDIAFMKSGGEAAVLKLTFARQTNSVRVP